MLEATNGNCAAPGRFETVGVASAVAGTWQLRVESFSGAGSFQADVFGAVGAAVPPPPRLPTGLTATATSAVGRERSTWSGQLAQDETGFEVQRCTGWRLHRLREAGDASARTARPTRTAASPRRTTYGYRVRVGDANGDSRRGPTPTRRRRRGSPAGSAPTTSTGLTGDAQRARRSTSRGATTLDRRDRLRHRRCYRCGLLHVHTGGHRRRPTSRHSLDSGLTATTTYGVPGASLRGNDASASRATPPRPATSDPADGAVPSAPTSG